MQAASKKKKSCIKTIKTAPHSHTWEKSLLCTIQCEQKAVTLPFITLDR